MNEKTTVNQRFIKCVNHLIKIKSAKNKTELAFNLRLSKSKFSEILNERMNVPIDTIAFISLFYGISADWLLNDKGDMISSKDNKNNETIKYKELAEARLDIIDGLKFKIASLEKTISGLNYSREESFLHSNVAEPTPELTHKKR